MQGNYCRGRGECGEWRGGGFSQDDRAMGVIGLVLGLGRLVWLWAFFAWGSLAPTRIVGLWGEEFL